MSDTKEFEESSRLMPPEFRQAFERYRSAEELRLRLGYPPSVVICGREYELSNSPVTQQHLQYVFDVATEASYHSAAQFINAGYLNFHGMRLGVCGQAAYKNGQITSFKNLSSISVRIPHQIKNSIPADILESLCAEPKNTLIAAPPGLGKTTALREIVRCLSGQGIRISLIDERGELSGVNNAFELGRCTDVISFVPKAEAAVFMLRAMNPQIIAMDEITKPTDINAVLDITGCGVHVLATVHGRSMEDMLHRHLYKSLISDALFENLITISLNGNEREYTLERIKA